MTRAARSVEPVAYPATYALDAYATRSAPRRRGLTMRTVALFGRQLPRCATRRSRCSTRIRRRARSRSSRSTSSPTTSCSNRYLERSRTLRVDGEVLFELFVDERDLLQRL